jgi:hypothetical protein
MIAGRDAADMLIGLLVVRTYSSWELFVSFGKVLFGKRKARLKWLTALPGLVALLFLGHAFEDGGPAAAVPYIAIVVMTVSYMVRPMLFVWVPVFAAFVFMPVPSCCLRKTDYATNGSYFRCSGQFPPLSFGLRGRGICGVFDFDRFE